MHGGVSTELGMWISNNANVIDRNDFFNTDPTYSSLVASGSITYGGITETGVQGYFEELVGMFGVGVLDGRSGWATCRNSDIPSVFAGRL